jgi:outer membrane receptor protein involved in Fe transport
MPLARVPFGAQVVEGEELRGAAHLTFADALLRLPGVSAADVMGSPLQPDIAMRGFGISPVMGLPQGLSVFVDGVRVNEPDPSQVNFNLIPLHDLERIEVLRGPSGPFGKNALGGSINLVTRRGEREPAGALEMRGGSFGEAEGRGFVSGARGGLDYYLSGRYLRTDGWREDAFAQMRHLFAKVGWRGGATDAWISYTLASDSILQAGSLPASWLEDIGAVPPHYRGNHTDPRVINFTGGDFYGPRLHFLTANLMRRLAGPLSLEANAFLRQNRANQFNANFTEPEIRIASAIRSLGGTAQLSYAAGVLEVVGGTEYAFNDVDLAIFQHPNPQHPTLPPAGDQTEDVGTREQNLAVYSQARLAATSRLALTGTLRYDYVELPFRDRLEPENDGDNLFRQLTGAAGVDYRLRGDLVLFGSYGRGFRAPVIMELACADPEDPCPLPYELGADPPLRPVTTDSLQAGVRYFGGGGLSAELVGYRAEVYDDIFFVQPVETRAGFFQNLEATRREGIELALQLRALPTLTLRGDLALTRATFQTTATLWAPYADDDDDDAPVFAADDDDDLDPPTVRPGDSFPMAPAVRANLGADYARGPWRLGVAVSHVGSQWLRGDEDNTEEEEKLEPYTLLGARVERDLGRATHYANVENLLDARYASFGVLTMNRLTDPAAPRVEPFVTPGPPRRIVAGARVRLW